MATQVVKPATAFSLTGGKQKRPRQKADAHLRWIRTLPCVVTGKRPVEAAHIRFGSPVYGKGDTGLQEKSHDKWAVPLCPDEHRKQHSMNEREYWRRLDIDPLAIASRLWAATGDDEAGEMIVRAAQRKAST